MRSEVRMLCGRAAGAEGCEDTCSVCIYENIYIYIYIVCIYIYIYVSVPQENPGHGPGIAAQVDSLMSTMRAMLTSPP